MGHTALDGTSVARILGGASSGKDGHGGNSDEGEFGEHYYGECKEDDVAGFTECFRGRSRLLDWRTAVSTANLYRFFLASILSIPFELRLFFFRVGIRRYSYAQRVACF